jgi:phage-related protein
VGLGPHVIDWVVVFCGGNEEARYRVRRFALQARAAIRSFCTRNPTRKVYDLCTQAPMS